MAEQTTQGRTVWNVLVPAVALVEADTAEQAEKVVERALEAAGLLAFEEDRNVFESEPVPFTSLFRAHRCPPPVLD